MKLAVVGLGRMGIAITRRLLLHGHQVVAYDLNGEAVREAAAAGAQPATSLEEAVGLLDSTPRIVWVMVPAGEPVALTLQHLAMLLDDGDIIIEGGNSNYRESQERATMLRYKGIQMLDIGTSGGVWGEHDGFNLMVGGDGEAFGAVEPILAALAQEGGYAHVGPSGAGHFVKMVHNGIEYGMMEAIAEGFELMAAKEEFGLDLVQLADLWKNGSVIRSWLLELAGSALKAEPGLETLAPFVEDSGHGRWIAQESIDLRVPLPAITIALQMRFRSRQENSFAARLLAAIRNQFGGHAVRRR